MQNNHYIEKENSFDQCRKPTSTAAYVLSLAGAKFKLQNLQFGGTCDGRLKHIDYYTAWPVEAYTNSQDMRVWCHSPPVLQFMKDVDSDRLNTNSTRIQSEDESLEQHKSI